MTEEQRMQLEFERRKLQQTPSKRGSFADKLFHRQESGRPSSPPKPSSRKPASDDEQDTARKRGKSKNKDPKREPLLANQSPRSDEEQKPVKRQVQLEKWQKERQARKDEVEDREKYYQNAFSGLPRVKDDEEEAGRKKKEEQQCCANCSCSVM
jgi:hypothetical protein